MKLKAKKFVPYASTLQKLSFWHHLTEFTFASQLVSFWGF
jgi:hypothetical protein